MKRDKSSRRAFVKLAAGSSIATAVSPTFLAGARAQELQRPARPISANERIGLATIGMGIIGFIDTETALLVPGVELVAAADLYTGRLGRVNELFGSGVAVTRDYREILTRPDVDAVIISTPDHWHAQIAVDALDAGKHVYLEKPMVQVIGEGPLVIDAQQRTGLVLQVGSQFASSMLYEKAADLYASGAIGQLNQIEASSNRQSSIGAWQYSVPPDASPQTVDWDRFLGNAPRRPFDPVRFFRWRNYWDYGTGLAGDLFVHLFTGIHRIVETPGPERVFSTGGLRFWKDGRDVPDVVLGLFGYPETESHADFTVALQSNLADGSGGGSSFRFIGSEGVMTITGSSVSVTRRPMRPPTEEQLVRGYNSVDTWAEPVRQAFVEQYRRDHPVPFVPEMGETREYSVPEGYDDRLDHLHNFFASIREGAPNVEDAVFGYRAAAPSLLSNLSYLEDKVYKWDPVEMRVLE